MQQRPGAKEGINEMRGKEGEEEESPQGGNARKIEERFV